MKLPSQRTILGGAFLAATMGAIGVTVYLSLDPKNYYFALGEDRTRWVYDSRHVMLISGLVLVESVCAGAALFSPRPRTLWLRCLLGLLVLAPWALIVTPVVIHMPRYVLFHRLWLWLLVFTLALVGLSSMTRNALLGLRRSRLPGRLPRAVTIRYQNTFRDIMAFNFYHLPRSPVFIGSYGVFIAFTWSTIFQAVQKNADTALKILTFAVLEIIALSCLTALFALSVVLSMVSRKNKTLFTEHTIMLGEDSFTEETPYNKTEVKWASVQKLARTKSYIFIYVAQHLAYVAPRRAFRDDAEWDAFYEYCRQRTRAA